MFLINSRQVVANYNKQRLMFYRPAMLTTRIAFAQCKRTYYQAHSMLLNGQTINYIQSGNGDHRLLCFPGAVGTIWSDFRPQIEQLNRQHFAITAWDPPGYGFSRPRDRQFGEDFYEQDANAAHEFMRALGHDRYSILGWSDGGISAMIMAAKYPKVVRRLVVWGCNAYVLPEELDKYEKIRDIANWSAKMKAHLVDLYTEEGLQKLWSAWCDALQEIYKKRKGDICKALLKDIQCPTMILHGDKDPMVAAEHPAYLLEHIKNATLHRFPNGKHNIHLRYPTEFNNLVTAFLLQEKLNYHL